MKIFNWVHKRFHHNTIKDGFVSNMKKSEPPMNNNGDSSQALLKQVALTDMLGGWKDGILTIGTLGYDPLNTNNNHKEYFALEDEKSGEAEHVGNDDNEMCFNNAEDDEELNPLMHNTFEHKFEDDVNNNKNYYYDDDDDATLNNEIVVLAHQPPLFSNEIIINNMESSNIDDDDEQKMKKRGERITLADLFLADSDVKFKMCSEKLMIESSEKSSIKAKNGISFAKKFIPRVKENPHPMKDIKKLMKKMLKRKIHPDLEAKNHKAEGQELTNTARIIDDHNNEIEGKTSIYCLPI